MKHRLILLLSCIVGFQSCVYPLSSGDQEFFVQANAYYKEEKFSAAQELYNKINEKSAYVHYNLGNCAYKQGFYGKALLHWRRAERDWGLFNRHELVHNIAHLKQQLKQLQGNLKEIKESPLEALKSGLGRLKEVVTSYIYSTPLICFQGFFLCMWLFLFISLKYLYIRRRKTIITNLFIIVALAGSLLALKYNFISNEYGVVIIQKADLLSGPGKNYQLIGFLPEAKEVLIQKKSGNFYKIKVSGQIGWVDGNAIEKI